MCSWLAPVGFLPGVNDGQILKTIQHSEREGNKSDGKVYVDLGCIQNFWQGKQDGGNKPWKTLSCV